MKATTARALCAVGALALAACPRAAPAGGRPGAADAAVDARPASAGDERSTVVTADIKAGIERHIARQTATGGGIDGYHCWVELYAEGKWWPIDISEADKYSALSTYYFGHHPANRLELSRGRDLVIEPLPATGPVNFLAYPLLEVDGQPVKADVTFSFVRTVKG